MKQTNLKPKIKKPILSINRKGMQEFTPAVRALITSDRGFLFLR